MKRVVSVSLGAPKGDHVVEATLAGVDFQISRIGTNGDMVRFAELLGELDGQVDAIGLGGINLYLYAGKHRFTIRDAAKLAANVKITSVVDGSGIKNTLERWALEGLARSGELRLYGRNILCVCATDRFGMADVISRMTRKAVYGDLMFNLGLPIPIRSHRLLTNVACALLPVACRLPFQWLYPTGDKQRNTPKHEKYFEWADVIAGDYKIIGKYMPPVQSGALVGKTIITNTLTSGDMEDLAIRGVRTIVTATQEFGGRVFATNVLEGIFITLADKRPEQMTEDDYRTVADRLDWEPTIIHL